MTSRLWGALAVYAVLIAIAVFLLHGTVLYAIAALLVGLLLKTLIAEKAGWNRGARTDSAPASETGSGVEHRD